MPTSLPFINLMGLSVVEGSQDVETWWRKGKKNGEGEHSHPSVAPSLSSPLTLLQRGEDMIA